MSHNKDGRFRSDKTTKSMTNMGVSKNNGTSKSSILIGFSIIFTIHFGGFPPIFGGPPISACVADNRKTGLAAEHRSNVLIELSRLSLSCNHPNFHSIKDVANLHPNFLF